MSFKITEKENNFKGSKSKIDLLSNLCDELKKFYEFLSEDEGDNDENLENLESNIKDIIDKLNSEDHKLHYKYFSEIIDSLDFINIDEVYFEYDIVSYSSDFITISYDLFNDSISYERK